MREKKIVHYLPTLGVGLGEASHAIKVRVRIHTSELCMPVISSHTIHPPFYN